MLKGKRKGKKGEQRGGKGEKKREKSIRWRIMTKSDNWKRYISPQSVLRENIRKGGGRIWFLGKIYAPAYTSSLAPSLYLSTCLYNALESHLTLMGFIYDMLNTYIYQVTECLNAIE